MPSPFPGMNPYLEQNDAWQDFHTNFIARAQELLNPQVGPNYVVKIEIRLILHEIPEEERGLALLDLPEMEVERHASLEIRDRRDRQVVTVIELLSPSNKQPKEDRDNFLAKRRHVIATHTTLVEIDLRRGGQRPSPPELPPCDYYVLVSRYMDRPRVGFWPIGLRDPLPIVPIPLAPSDPLAHLDLKAVLDRAYDSADYGKYIYREPPEPPLSPADQVWARSFVPQKAYTA